MQQIPLLLQSVSRAGAYTKRLAGTLATIAAWYALCDERD